MIAGNIRCSQRGQKVTSLIPTYIRDAISAKKYNPTRQPNDAIQLCVAENKMVEDLLVPAVQRFAGSNDNVERINPRNCYGSSFINNQIYYQPTHGRLGLRSAMASYLHRMLQLPSTKSLDQEGLVLGSGCNAVLENICFCLADKGDGVLIPTPYYAAFEFDLGARADLIIIPVNTMAYQTTTTTSTIPAQSYYPNVASLNSAYENSIHSGIQPKILLLSHPNNPLGIYYPPEVIQECIDWSRKRQIHLISDEIYAGSVYRKESNSTINYKHNMFQSVLTLAGEGQGHGWMNTDDITDGKKNSNENELDKPGLGLGPYIHFVYSLSKDFCLSGLRVGVAYSENEEIRNAMQKLNDLCQISSQTQLTVERMLSTKISMLRNNNEKEVEQEQLWCTDNFLIENSRRIQARRHLLQKHLDLLGIPHLDENSGLFVWIDMTEFLPSNQDNVTAFFSWSKDDIDDQREAYLYRELMTKYGLIFTPGRSMRNELPGFFRCVFTAVKSDDEFNLVLERLTKFVINKRRIASENV